MDKSRNAIRSNVTAKVEQLIADGTTAMSLVNLLQITPTTGVTCAVPMYRGLFDEIAREVATKLKFRLY
jgi:hypothetical protein